MEQRELNSSEITAAKELTLEVFMEFEAPEYPAEGVEEFQRFLSSSETEQLRFFGALEQETLRGVLAMRQEHISLLFVKKAFHRNGIAKALFTYMLEQLAPSRVTVNSSPYARNVYEKLGFQATNSEQLTNGIRYIPMIYEHR